MRRHTLEITRNQNFVQEFSYLTKKQGQDYGINIEDYTVVWEVLQYSSSEELLINETSYTMSESNLKNGFISVEMNATQTGAIDEEVSTAIWSLYIEDVANDNRYKLAEGNLRIYDWSPFEEVVK